MQTAEMSVNVSDNTAVKRLDIMVDGKSVATYSQEDVKEAGGKIVYTLNSSNSKQKVKAVAVDMADNEATSDNHNILITTNLFIQYINNKPLFYSTVGGGAALIIAILGIATRGFGYASSMAAQSGFWWTILGKRREDEDED